MVRRKASYRKREGHGPLLRSHLTQEKPQVVDVDEIFGTHRPHRLVGGAPRGIYARPVTVAPTVSLRHSHAAITGRFAAMS
jgi:hypothetical protein